MTIAGPRERLDGDRFRHAHPQLPPRPPRHRPPRPARGAPSRPRAAPPASSSGAAYSSEDRQRRQGTGHHDVLGAKPVRPLLGARVDDLHVRRARARGPPTARKAHLRPTLSTSATRARRQRRSPARGPETRLQSRDRRVAGRRGPPAASSATSESATWASTPSAGSRTAVMAAGSAATRSRSTASCRSAPAGSS